MADVKALQDITSEQTAPASADLLFIEKAGVPAKITFDALTSGIVDDYEEALKVTETAGSGNAYTLNLTPDAATYHDGQRLMLRVDRTNTDAVTLAVDGQAAKAVQRYDDTGTLVDLAAGQWQIGQVHVVYYDGTRFVCVTPVAATQADTEAGTNNADFITPLRAVQSYQEQRLTSSLGWGQTWQNVTGSRSGGVSYQNTTGQPIMVCLLGDGTYRPAQVSLDNSTWTTVGAVSGEYSRSVSFIVPNGHYYRVDGGGAGITIWAELRS